MTADPTKRFSDRVDNYIKYRPGYPTEVVDHLTIACDLTFDSIIADIGAGTGIFTKLLLNRGFKVYAIDPNQPMLDAAIRDLSGDKNFNSITAPADATTLPDKSVDLITCAQAFHWFNNENTKAEFKRILKPGAKAALIWNNRITDTDEFALAYDNLLKNESVDYNAVNHQNISDIDFKAFFKDGKYTDTEYPNQQIFDENGLIGRAYSSSYVPPQDTDAGKTFLILLKELFAKFNRDGKVSFHYQTEIYLGEV